MALLFIILAAATITILSSLSSSFVEAVSEPYYSFNWTTWPSSQTSITSANCDSILEYPNLRLHLADFSALGENIVLSIDDCQKARKIWVDGSLSSGSTLQIINNQGLDQIMFLNDNRSLPDSDNGTAISETIDPFDMKSNSKLIITNNRFTVSLETSWLANVGHSNIYFENVKLVSRAMTLDISNNIFDGRYWGFGRAINFLQCYFDDPELTWSVTSNNLTTVSETYADNSILNINGGTIRSAKLLNFSSNYGEASIRSAVCYFIYFRMYAVQNIQRIDMSDNVYRPDGSEHQAVIIWRVDSDALQDGIVSDSLNNQIKNIRLITANRNLLHPRFQSAISEARFIGEDARVIEFDWFVDPREKANLIEEHFVADIGRMEMNNNILRNGMASDLALAVRFECRLATRNISFVQINNNYVEAFSWNSVYAVYFQFVHFAASVNHLEIAHNFCNGSMQFMDSLKARPHFRGMDYPFATGGVVHCYFQAETWHKNHLEPKFTDVEGIKVHIFNNSVAIEANKVQLFRLAFWNLSYPVDIINVSDNYAVNANIVRVNNNLQVSGNPPDNGNLNSESSCMQLSFQPRNRFSRVLVQRNNCSINFRINPKSDISDIINAIYGISFILSTTKGIGRIDTLDNYIHLSPLRRAIGIQGGLIGIDYTLPQPCGYCAIAERGPLGPSLISGNTIFMGYAEQIPLGGCFAIAVRKVQGLYADLADFIIDNNTIDMVSIAGNSNSIGIVSFVNLNGLDLPLDNYNPFKLPAVLEIFLIPRGVSRLDFYGDIRFTNNRVSFEQVNRDFSSGIFVFAGGRTRIFGDIVFEGNPMIISKSASPSTLTSERRQQEELPVPSSSLISFQEITAKVDCDIPKDRLPAGLNPQSVICFLLTNQDHPRTVEVRKISILAGNHFSFSGSHVGIITSQVPLFVYEGIEVVNSTFDFKITTGVVSHSFIRRLPFSGFFAQEERLLKGKTNYNILHVPSISMSGSHYSVDASTSTSTLSSSQQETLDPNQYLSFVLFSRDDFNLSLQEFDVRVENESSISLKDSLQPNFRSVSPASYPREVPSFVKFVPSRMTSSTTANNNNNDRLLFKANISFINTSLESSSASSQSSSSLSLKQYSSLFSNLASTNFGMRLINTTLLLSRVSTSARLSVVGLDEKHNQFSFTSVPKKIENEYSDYLMMRSRFNIKVMQHENENETTVTDLPQSQEERIRINALVKEKIDSWNAIINRNQFLTETAVNELHVMTELPDDNIYSSIILIPKSSLVMQSSSSSFNDDNNIPPLFAQCIFWNTRRLSTSSNFGFPLLSEPYPSNLFVEPNLFFEKCRPESSLTKSLSASFSVPALCISGFSLLNLGQYSSSILSVRQLLYYKRYVFSIGIVLPEDTDGNGNRLEKLPGQEQSAEATVFKYETRKDSLSFDPALLKRSVSVVSGNNAVYVNESYSIAPRSLKIVLLVSNTEQLDQESDFSFTIKVDHALLACRTELNDGELELQKKNPELFGDRESSNFNVKTATEVTITLDKTAPGVAEDLVKNIGDAGRVASAVTAATGSGMVASTMARSLLLGRYVDCLFDPAEGPLEFELSPLGWAVGRQQGRFLRGAVVGNGVLLVLMFTSLSVLVTIYLWRRDRSRKAQWKKDHPEERFAVDVKNNDKNNNNNNSNGGKPIVLSHTKMKSKGPPSVLTWKKFRMSLLSIGATSMLYNLNNILVQGSVSSSVSLILYGPQESIWMDRMMGIGTILVTFGVGIYMIWVIAYELPRRSRIQYYYNMNREKGFVITQGYGLMLSQNGGGANGAAADAESSDSPDEAEILKYVLHVPSSQCAQCAAERMAARKRRSLASGKSFRGGKSSSGLKRSNSVSSPLNPNGHKSFSKKKPGGKDDEFTVGGKNESIFGANSGRGRIDLLDDDDEPNSNDNNNKLSNSIRKERRASSVGTGIDRKRRRSSVSRTNLAAGGASTSSHPMFGESTTSDSVIRRNESNLFGMSTTSFSRETTNEFGNNNNINTHNQLGEKRPIQKRNTMGKSAYRWGKQFFSYYGFWRVSNSQQFANSSKPELKEHETSFTNDKKFFLFTNDVFRDTHCERKAYVYPTFIYCLNFSLACIQGYAPQAESDSCRGFGTSLALLNCLPSLWLLSTFPFRHWLMNLYTSLSSFVIVFQSVVLLVGYLESNYELGWLQVTSLILTMTLQMVGVFMMLMDIIMVFFESPYFVVYIGRRLRHIVLHRVGNIVRDAEGFLLSNNSNQNQGLNHDDKKKSSLDRSPRHGRTTVVNILEDAANDDDAIDLPLLGSKNKSNNNNPLWTPLSGSSDSSSNEKSGSSKKSSNNNKVVKSRSDAATCWTL